MNKKLIILGLMSIIPSIMLLYPTILLGMNIMVDGVIIFLRLLLWSFSVTNILVLPVLVFFLLLKIFVKDNDT